MSTTQINEACVKICNSLLRGELSAVETYGQAIKRYPTEAVTSELTRIQAEHRESAETLTNNVLEMGGIPETDSGGWGTFANAVQGAANLFGADSAIGSLQNGEEHGRNDYRDALANDDMMESCKAKVREQLLPRVEGHISVLERLEEVAD